MAHQLRVCLIAVALLVPWVVQPVTSAASPENPAVGKTNTADSSTVDAVPRQDLIIVKAQYGIPGQFLDVTKKVRDMVRDNAIDLRGHYETVLGDPAPGVYKSLIITYSSGGNERTVVASDYGVLQVPLPERKTGLQIVEATYGAKKAFLDVKDTLQSMIEGDRLLLTRPLYQVFGDPLPGVPKTLKVRYQFKQLSGKTVTFKDGTVVSIP